MNDAPVLDAYPDGDRLKVWCVHCDRWHFHGATGGHRVAHCSSGPYRETGYVLRRVDEGGQS